MPKQFLIVGDSEPIPEPTLCNCCPFFEVLKNALATSIMAGINPETN